MSVSKQRQHGLGVEKEGRMESIYIKYPKSKSEVQEIVDCIRRGIVVINLEYTETQEKEKLLEFICGAVYALYGDIFAITKDLYMITIQETKVSGEVNIYL